MWFLPCSCLKPQSATPAYVRACLCVVEPFWHYGSWGFLLSSVVLQSKPSMRQGKYVQCSRPRSLRSSSPAHFGSVKASHTKKIHDFLYRFVQINQSKLFDSCCRTLGLAFQSENFSYNHCTNYVMDSWPYPDTPNPEQKFRLNPGEPMTALTILQEQCRVKKKNNFHTLIN